METVLFNSAACHTGGSLPAVGEKAPGFNLVGTDLKEIRLSDYAGRRVVLNVFPSLDTPVCAASVRRFNKMAGEVADVTVINVSMDLPFAASRFCAAEGLKNVVVGSAFRSPSFAQNYGLQLTDGPLAGLLARAVIVIGPDGKIAYEQLVDEITHEPDYHAVLDLLKH